MKKLVRFFLAGAPSFLVALPLNYALVTAANLPKSVAYALVLIVQVTINFFACRHFVFDTNPKTSLGKSFVIFFNGILLFRVADWGVYVLLTTKLGMPFLAAQLFNVALFGVLKFGFARRVFEQKVLNNRGELEQ